MEKDAGEQETSPKRAPRRRLVAMSDDEDEEADEETSKSPDKAAAIDKDKESKDKKGVDKVGSQIPENRKVMEDASAYKNAGSDSEEDNRQLKKKKKKGGDQVPSGDYIQGVSVIDGGSSPCLLPRSLIPLPLLQVPCVSVFPAA